MQAVPSVGVPVVAQHRV